MYYMEFALGNLKNRKKYADVNTVINLSFQEKLKYIETWRSMFFYKTKTPKEGDFLCGNFYIETDNPNFIVNKNIIIEVCEFLNKKYDIPFEYMNLFKTNRSFWLEIPFKVFGTNGDRKLNLIYKQMANEINLYLKKQYNEENTILDLSIYKWNSLIHSLGSFLPKKKQRVYKLSYWDLDDIYREQDILNVKWDYFFSYKDVTTVPKAAKWFNKIKNNLFINNNCVLKDKPTTNTDYMCMKNLENNGLVNGSRNNCLYSYTLYLKETTNLNLSEIIKKVQYTFKSNKYVFTNEAIKTIKSAYKGKKHFSCKFIKDNYLCKENCKKRISKHIYIPRTFISLLNENKCNWKSYYILLDILYKNQIDKEDFKLDISKERHKKDFIKNIEMLKKINIINYEIINNIVYITLCNFPKEVYTNYVLFPISLYKSKKYHSIQKSVKVLLELLRCSIITSTKNYYVNVKIKTLVDNLKSTVKNIKKHMLILKKLNICFGKYLIMFNFKRNKKQIIKTILKKYIFNKTNNIKFFLNNNFCNYLIKQNFVPNLFFKLLNKTFPNIGTSLRLNFDELKINDILFKIDNS